jgi:hypothetical protein
MARSFSLLLQKLLNEILKQPIQVTTTLALACNVTTKQQQRDRNKCKRQPVFTDVKGFEPGRCRICNQQSNIMAK